MPALDYRHSTLQRRGEDTGRTFSIAFGFVALVVVVACLIWGIVLPKFRKKNNEGPPSGLPTFHGHRSPANRFPSHPALLRGFRKHPPPTIRRYDPRVESPFPSSPTQLKSLPHPTASDHCGLLQVVDVPYTSHGLFTPLNERPAARSEHTTRGRGNGRPGGSFGGSGTGAEIMMNDMQEYILPVPEPLVLKPRPAGRPPPLTRQLERFPMPLSSARKAGLLHPGKLFQELEQRDSKSTSGTYGTPCPTPSHSMPFQAASQLSLGAALRGDSNARGCAACEGRMRDRSLHCENPKCTGQEAILLSTESGHWTGEAIHKPTTQLGRAGTVTRPKTPVSEMREWLNRAASHGKTENASIKRSYTPSTNPFTTPRFSSTAPTSPAFSTKQHPAPSTPLQTQCDVSRMHAAIPEGHRHRRTPSSVTLPSQEDIIKWQGTPRKRVQRPKRSKPSRLNFVSLSNLRSRKGPAQRRSLSSLSTIFKPIITARSKHSHGASSAYSRDTKGMSALGSSNPDGTFHVPAEWPFGQQAHLTRQSSASMDPLQTKIDNWDLHTDDLDAAMLTPSALKRSFSDYGPRGAAQRPSHEIAEPKHDGVGLKPIGPERLVPLSHMARSSDDIFGDEGSIKPARRGFRRPELPMTGDMRRGSAPGGGEWI